MYLILAILAARIMHITTKYRRGVYNGFITIEATLKKNTSAPMVYRLLIPHLTKFFPSLPLVWRYEFWRTLLLWLALLLVSQYWGLAIALIWLLFVMSAQVYDTWCYTSETIGLTLALMGDPFAAAIGIFVHGMSRETVLINGFVYWLATGDAVGGICLTLWAGAVFGYVRVKQGKHKLYCDRFPPRRNWKILTREEQPTVEGDFVPFFYGAWINVGMSLVALYGAYLVGRIGWFVPVMIAMNFAMAKANEYRLLIPVATFAAVALERML